MGIALRVSYTLPGSEAFTEDFDMVNIDSRLGWAAGVSQVVKESGETEGKRKMEKMEHGKYLKLTFRDSGSGPSLRPDRHMG